MQLYNTSEKKKLFWDENKEASMFSKYTKSIDKSIMGVELY